MSNETGTPTEPEMMSVDFGGTTLELPKEQASALIKERDELKARERESAQKLAQIEEQAKAKERAIVEAEERAKAIEAAKKGDIEALELQLKDKYGAQVQTLTTKLLDKEVKGLLHSAEGIRKGTIDVLGDYLKSRLQYDDQGNLAVFENGNKLDTSPSDYLKSWLSEHPDFVAPTTPAGSGAGEGNPPASAAKTMRRETWEQIKSAGGEAYKSAVEGLHAGTLQIIDT